MVVTCTASGFRSERKPAIVLAGCLSIACFLSPSALPQSTDEFELPPLNYSATVPQDAVQGLVRELEQQPRLLAAPTEKGFVENVLRRLKVPVESQLLVFSKTSLQRQNIHPSHPRAIYFSDDCYVGWVPGADMEIISFDPVLGATFYRIPRSSFTRRPEFVRDPECLSCHASAKTRGVPAPFVRSVFTAADGEPILSAGTFQITHENPISERWGGWYVTGSHGSSRHMGNEVARPVPEGAVLDRESGANLKSLERYFDRSLHLLPSSDIVALMVFEHQSGAHQRLLEANQSCRIAIHRWRSIRRELGEAETNVLSGSALSVARSQVQKLLEELLFVREGPLPPEGLQGDAGFAKAFEARGFRDPKGRSLRDLDGRTHLFKHRLSYMIFSPSLESLPVEVRDIFWQRLSGILSERDSAAPFDLLTRADKRAIVEILRASPLANRLVGDLQQSTPGR